MWFAKLRDLVPFLRCKHTPQAIGPATAKTQQYRAPSTLAAVVSRGQGLYCLVLCVLRECVCVWSPTSGTKGAAPACCTKSIKNVQSSQQSSDRSFFCTNTTTTHTRQNKPYRLGVVPAGAVGARGRCCPAATVPVAVVFAGGVCCCIAEEIRNKIIHRKTELRHDTSSSTKQRAQQRVREQHTQEFQRWVFLGVWFWRRFRVVHVLFARRSCK